MLTSNDKGLIAELEIELAAVRLGVPVFKPLDEHSRSDLAFDISGRIWRVQCKWGRVSEDRCAVIVNTGRHWLSSGGYVRKTYTEHEVDLFGVYCGGLDRSFLLPASVAVGKALVHLRLVPPRNQQRACINLADDFDFVGAVAQLGERRSGTPKATGSSPVSSINSSNGPITVGSNPFRDKLGYWMERVAAGEEVIITHRGRPRIRLSPAAASSP
jgi:prevent-host-death family protein